MVVPYKRPVSWIEFDNDAISMLLVEAKAKIASLRTLPCQREWLERLHALEFKREVAGTSRIEGADFTEKELDAAVDLTVDEIVTRSQRQARAAVRTYRWIATLPDDRAIDEELILEIHRQIVTGADDDHCAPGELRPADYNVTFGQPRHRGAKGGRECKDAFKSFVEALTTVYKEHDPIIQAIAAHYHLAAMHPFMDGNGRTARALEALLLQRAGLRDNCFIAMSNYYYEEKPIYLKTLSKVRENEYDLTEFMKFALAGIVRQLTGLLSEIEYEISKVLFANMMYSLFERLKSPKKRVIAKRQMAILKFLLDHGETDTWTLYERQAIQYSKLKSPRKAFVRDVNDLIRLGTVKYWLDPRNPKTSSINVRLEWPTEITETKFFETLMSLPKVKSESLLSD